MDILAYLIGVCIILGILIHITFNLFKNAKSICKMDIQTARKVMFGSNLFISDSKVKKELYKKRAMSVVETTIGAILILILTYVSFNVILERFLLAN